MAESNLDPFVARVGALWEKASTALLDLEDAARDLGTIPSTDDALAYYLEIKRAVGGVRTSANNVLKAADGVMEGRVRRRRFSGAGLPPDDDEGASISVHVSELPKI